MSFRLSRYCFILVAIFLVVACGGPNVAEPIASPEGANRQENATAFADSTTDLAPTAVPSDATAQGPTAQISLPLVNSGGGTEGTTAAAPTEAPIADAPTEAPVVAEGPTVAPAPGGRATIGPTEASLPTEAPVAETTVMGGGGAASISDQVVQDVTAVVKTYVQGYVDVNKATVQVDALEGDFARARLVVGENTTAPTFVFLKQQNGQWSVLTIGTSFNEQTYEQYSIPESLWLR